MFDPLFVSYTYVLNVDGQLHMMTYRIVTRAPCADE
jgi:hypothetical protein